MATKILALWLGLMLAQTATAQPGAIDFGPVRAANADNRFGLRLLAETRKESLGENVVQSPVGLALALGMVENGASGETLRQMQQTVHPEGMTTKEWNAANKSWLDHLHMYPGRGFDLEIANSVWKQTGGPIRPEFLADCTNWYGAEVGAVDFASPTAAKTINAWANEKTHGKIPSIFDRTLPDTRLVVLDAIYFKGTWAQPFDQSLTRERPFALRGGQTIQHPRMTLKGHIRYLENTECQAVALSYAGGGLMSLYVFLPKGNLDDFLRSALPEKPSLEPFPPREGTLELPRFKLEASYKLNGELKALGMPRAFTHAAELGGIAEEKLALDEVVQKTMVDVNEAGTEAAAVSGITVRPSLVRRPTEPPFSMVVDRPFYWAIVEIGTGAILFHGAIEDPRGK